jgi:hypothetical protein
VFAAKVKAKDPDHVEKLISEGVHWKVHAAKFKDISHAYTILTVSPTEAERLLEWENSIY